MSSRLKQILDYPNKWFLFAVAGTILFFATFIPMMLAPAFLVVTTWKYGMRMGIAVASVTSLFVLILFHLPVLIFFLSQCIVVGLLVGEGLRRKEPALNLLAKTTFASTLILLAAGAFFYFQAPETSTELLQKGSEAIQHALEENAQRRNLDSESILENQKSLETLIRIVKVTFPALLFINSFSIVYLNLLVSLLLAGTLGLDRSHVPPLRDLSIPFVWVWGLIVSGFLFILKIPFLKWIGLNLLLILLLVYLMQGYGILSFYLNRTRLPRMVRVLIYLATFLSFPLLIVLCGVGLFDTWFEFRKKAVQEKP